MTIEEIFACAQENKRMIDLETADFGSFVIIDPVQGKETSFENNVGYLIQIREKRGDSGTDQVLIRHPDGKITAHENQFFYKIDNYSAMLMLPYFKIIPGEELISNNFNLSFIADGIEENGFYVESE